MTKIFIDKHIHNLFFTKRRYHCKVISRSNHAIYLSLNNCRIITLLKLGTKWTKSKLGTHPNFPGKLGCVPNFANLGCVPNFLPNPITAVFPDKFPEFFIKNDEFYVSGGKFKPVVTGRDLSLQFKLHKTKNIKSIKWDKINTDYIEQIRLYLETAPIGIKLGTHPNFPGKLGCVPNFNFDALCEIAGLGPGLTPSTDDFICGIISVLKISPHPALSPEGRGSDLMWKIPFMKIARQILKRTTKISWYYIVLAMMGYAADWQYDILKNIFKNNVGTGRPSTGSGHSDLSLQNIHHGHTSGNDWLYGIYFMLKLL